MNLEDLIGENGLQQDEWSLTAPTFGKDSQLTVVGWSGKSNNGHKIYIVVCAVCCKDNELFGEGYFRSFKGHLSNGGLPCGCSNYTKWNKDQYSVLCSRKAEELGYTFLGFRGEWKSSHTHVILQCPLHIPWNRCVIHHLVSGKAGCPECFKIGVGKRNTKSDQVMIESFFASGDFHPETKFWRSERKTKQGYKSYWYVSCPDCGEQGESFGSHLQLGCRPCACNKQRQQEGYINLVVDNQDNIIAIKFGIAKDSKQRIKRQSRQSVYELHQHSVYVFPDVASCKRAERECLQELECRVVLKRDVPDGYTETTWVSNLEKIVEIYERNGGIRKENP